MQVVTNVYILNITCHHTPKYVQVSDKKHPNKHILVPRRAKHHTLTFSCDKDCEHGPSIFEEWKKNIFSFVEYIFFAPAEGFCCSIADGGAQYVWTNILIFKFIVLRLVIYSMSGTILERFGQIFFYRFRVHVIWAPKLKIVIHQYQ